MSSNELMEGVLIKLKQLGSKGERVLELLQQVDKTKLLADVELMVEDTVSAKPTETISTDIFMTTTTNIMNQVNDAAATTTTTPAVKIKSMLGRCSFDGLIYNRIFCKCNY